MIKWFCDLCGAEIVAPEHPVSVKAYRTGKNRDDAEIGWGESDYFVEMFCHANCAGALVTVIKAAVQDRSSKAREQTTTQS